MATNPYSYGSLGQRWTVGEPTSKSLLDISRVKNDANRWTLEQLIPDPDTTQTLGFDLSFSSSSQRLLQIYNASASNYFQIFGGRAASSTSDHLVFSTGTNGTIMEFDGVNHWITFHDTAGVQKMYYRGDGSPGLILESGVDLTVGGTGTFSGNVTISKDAPQLIMTDSGSGGGTSDIIIDAIGSNHGFYFRADGATNHVILESNGDFKVDADTLFVDASADRVGINTSSADASLHIEGSSVSDLVKVEDTGTDSNPNIQIANDARSYNLQVVGARSDAFEIWDRTAGATRLSISTSGNMGLGVTPSAWRSTETALQIDRRAALYADSHVTTALANNLIINNSGYALIEADAASQYYQYQGAHVWQTVASGSAGANVSPSTVMTILSGGDVGLGTQSPEIRLSVTDTYNGSALTSNDIPAVQIINEQGSYTADNVLGVLGFGKSQGFASGVRAGMVAYYSGTGSQSSNVGAYLSFRTSADAAGDSTERARITSAGNVGIGTSSPSTPLHVRIDEATVGASSLFRLERFTIGDSHYLDVSIDNSGNNVGFKSTGSSNGSFTFGHASSEYCRLDTAGQLLIGYTSSNGGYKLQVNSQIFATNATIATSDGRYKEDVQTLSNATDLVSRLNPVQFKWKSHEIHNLDVGKTDVGFIAQEVQEVLSDTDYSDSVVVTNKTDDEEYLGLGETKLIPLLTAALQEAITKIKTLENKVAALEAA